MLRLQTDTKGTDDQRNCPLVACAGVAAVVRRASKTRPLASNTIMCGGPKKNLASLVTKSRFSKVSFSHEIEAYILKKSNK